MDSNSDIPQTNAQPEDSWGGPPAPVTQDDHDSLANVRNEEEYEENVGGRRLGSSNSSRVPLTVTTPAVSRFDPQMGDSWLEADWFEVEGEDSNYDTGGGRRLGSSDPNGPVQTAETLVVDQYSAQAHAPSLRAARECRALLAEATRRRVARPLENTSHSTAESTSESSRIYSQSTTSAIPTSSLSSSSMAPTSNRAGRVTPSFSPIAATPAAPGPIPATLLNPVQAMMAESVT